MKHKTAKANVKTKTRLLSLLLAVLMTLFCFPVTALVNGETNGGNASEMSDSVQNIGLSEQTNGLSELTDVPKIALNGMSEEDGEPVRLPLLEKDLYTIAYTDTSGQCKMKMFSYPVKYVDTDGKIKDISLEIEQDENGGFRTAANNIITKFPQKLTDGISLEYDDIKIEMIPVESTDGKISTEKIGAFNAMLSADNKKVSYTFGSKTRLDYELTYTGFKEDIVVESYTGQTEYNFFIKTNGLTLTERSGSYFIEDSDGNVKATIGDIIIFTADERNNTFGSMTHTVIKENQIYAMTVHVDAEFLKDEKTAYPIRIDPTVEINYDNNGAGAIEDYTINTIDTLSGSSGSICLGKYASDGSVSRILMRIPNFNFSQYTQNQIVNVSVNIRDLQPGTAEAVVSCYRFTGNTWSESSSVSWNGVNANAYSDLQDTKTVSYASGNAQPTTYWYSFNITNAAKQWAAGTVDQSKGIIFKAADTTESGSAHVYKTFASYNRASYKPTVTVVYNNSGVLITNETNIHIAKNTSVNLYCEATLSASAISYTSSDSNIVSVDSNGNVYGENEGVAIITASITDVNGDECFIKYTVSVYHLCEGDFYITSAVTENFLNIDANSNVLLTKYQNNSTQIWRLEKDSSGKYCIIKNTASTRYRLGAYLSGVTQDNKNIYELQLVEAVSPPSDNELWEFIYRSAAEGFIIQNSAYGCNITYDDKNILSVVDGIGTYRGWCLKKDINNITEFGISIPSWLPAINKTYDPLGWGFYTEAERSDSNATFSLPRDFTWESSDENVISIDQNGCFTTGSNKNGYCVITIKHKSTELNMQFVVSVGQTIAPETYHIMNIASDRYIDIEGGSANNNAYIQESDYHENNYAKWIFDYDGEGYYTIRSVYSNKYLSAVSANGGAIVQTNVISNLARWRVMVTADGNYKFVAKLTSNNMVLSLPSLSENTGTNLVLQEYVDESSKPEYNFTPLYTDEWLLQLKRDVSLLSVHSEANITDFFVQVESDLTTMGYSDIFSQRTFISDKVILNHMAHSKISVIVTHGMPEYFVASNDNITIDELSALPEDAFEYSDLVVFSACYSGVGGNTDRERARNVVNAICAHGAKTVIGFEIPVNAGEFDKWCEYFFDFLRQGNTVGTAANLANENLYPSDQYQERTTEEIYIAGDVNAVLLPAN